MEKTNQTSELSEAQFNAQKRNYFSELAGSLTSAFAVHQAQGLWKRTPEGSRDWGNVSEHCLVEAARVGVMADLLQLPSDVKRDVQLAAALHDHYKKGEKEIMTAHGLSLESYDQAGEASAQVIRDAGFSEQVTELASSVGHATVIQAEALATKPELTDYDKAWLAMHYCDDYTVNAEWAAPSEFTATGQRINDLDRRMDKNEANPRYAVMNQPDQNGRTIYGEQRRVGHLVESRLADLISHQTGQEIPPVDLPTIIDGYIYSAIVATPEYDM